MCHVDLTQYKKLQYKIISDTQTDRHKNAFQICVMEGEREIMEQTNFREFTAEIIKYHNFFVLYHSLSIK